MSYNQFSMTYDQLMDKSLYQKWYLFMQPYINAGDTICDVACGSGDLLALLEKNHHFHTIGCDLSNTMLACASEKLNQTQLYQMDMCSLQFEKESIDIVTCFADSLCYLQNDKQLKEAFQSVYTCLKKEGFYLFDVHSIYQMEVGYKDYSYHYCDDDMLFIWQSFSGKEKYVVEHDISCVKKMENGFYERYDETHIERTYELNDYIQWLYDCGFSSVVVKSDFGNTPVHKTTNRWFFICQK